VRSYKKSLSHETAVEIITVGDGRTMPSHFDPDILQAFKRCAKAFRDIFELQFEHEPPARVLG